jgi:copper chaperone
MKTEIHVSGMRCSGCEMLVQEALEEIDGVEKARASHATGVVDVDFDDLKVTVETLKSVIESQGYQVTA